MVESGSVRVSGRTTAQEITQEEAEKHDTLAQVETPEERETRFRTPGFARMRLDWRGDDRVIIQRAKQMAEARLVREFTDAYHVMNTVYTLVRTPEVNRDGQVVRDKWGFVQWKRTAEGDFEEDFSALTLKQRENLMLTLTTRLFAWEQQAADAWSEAMFAKSQWEERYSLAFDAPMAGTIEDRRAVANVDAAEERYFAVYLTYYSRKADALVRSLTLLAQRLKDSMVT